MPDITFTNGSRIFTPSQPPQLGDVNLDGVIDILDAGDVNAFQLTDLNGDGIIDILDASEFLANGPGGIEIISVPEPKPKILECPTGQKPKDKYAGPGITIEVCGECIGTKLETAVCEACSGIPKSLANGALTKVTILDYENAIVTCEYVPTPWTCYQCNEIICGEEGICGSNNDWWYIIGGDYCYATELDCYWETYLKYNQYPFLGSPEHLGGEGIYFQAYPPWAHSQVGLMCDCFEYQTKLKYES